MNIADSRNIRHWLALSSSLSSTTLLTLLKHYKDPDIICNTSPYNLAKKSGLSVEKVTIKPDRGLIDKQLEILIQKNVYLLTWLDKKYPPRLREISRPPPILFVMGNLEALSSLQLAMVGSRRASQDGIEAAHRLALALGKTGLGITSGLALGIDKICHEAALAAATDTVAVLGSGLDVIYPYAHRALAHQIIEKKGALVSEFSFGTPPKASHFPQRNRIISGLSLGTLVIEASLRSGSLITARYAIEQNREVFAVPGSIRNPLAAGCHQLLKQGAKLVETAEDVLEEFPMFQNPNKRLSKRIQ